MQALEKDWDRFMEDAGKFWRTAKKEATGGKSAQEMKQSLLTPVEDPEIQGRSQVYFYVKQVMDAVFTGKDDLFHELDMVDKVLADLNEIYLHEGREFEASLKKGERARAALIGSHSVDFLKDRFTKIREKHEKLGTLADQVTKLQFKVEQLTRVYNDEDASKVFAFVKKNQWLEKAQDELDVAKPEFFKAMDEFMEEFHETRREFFQIWKEDLQAYDKSLEEAYGAGIEEPKLEGVDFSQVDATATRVLKHKQRMAQETP